MYIVLRDPITLPAAAQSPWHAVVKIFQSRNIVVSMFGLFCAMTGVFVLSAMMPNYLVDYLQLSTAQMGVVTSALGFGGSSGSSRCPESPISGTEDRGGSGLRRYSHHAAVVHCHRPESRHLFALPLYGLFFLPWPGFVVNRTNRDRVRARRAGHRRNRDRRRRGRDFRRRRRAFVGGYIAKNYGIQNILYLPQIRSDAGVIVCLFPQGDRSAQGRRPYAESGNIVLTGILTCSTMFFT